MTSHPDPEHPATQETTGSPQDREVEEVLEELSRVNNELVASQRRLERRTAQLDRTVARMNELLGMTAHDLRNPIGAVRGLAEVLLQRTRDRLEPRETAVLRRITESSNRMLTLVDDLVDLSQLEHGVQLDVRRVDLRTVLTEAVEMADIVADDKQITLHLDARDPVVLLADAVKLDGVIMNLVTNAIKYSHRGSRVDIVLQDLDDHVELRVTDQGVGVPPDEQETIFRPFGKGTSRPTEGEASTGLGLAIADRIVRAHGGQLTVASEEGRGSTFTVTLPRRAPT